MSKNIESQVKQRDSVWLILAIFGVITSIASFYYLDQFNTLMKVIIMLAGIGISVGLLFLSSYGNKITFFIKETKIEILKVVWPTKQETLRTTLLIIVAVIIVGIFLWLVDMFLTWVLKFLTI